MIFWIILGSILGNTISKQQRYTTTIIVGIKYLGKVTTLVKFTINCGQDWVNQPNN